MQGDNTDSVLTSSKANSFNDNLTKYLMNRSHYSIGEAVDKAFADLSTTIMRTTVEPGLLMFGLFWTGFSILHAFLMFKGMSGNKAYKNAVKVEENSEEFKCEFCGCIYTNEIAKKYEFICPHCSAPLPSSGTNKNVTYVNGEPVK